MSDKPVVPLEITAEEYEEIKVSECLHVAGYVNEDGSRGKSWVQCIGTRAECQESDDAMSHQLYVVPTGMTIETSILNSADLLPPVEVQGE